MSLDGGRDGRLSVSFREREIVLIQGRNFRVRYRKVCLGGQFLLVAVGKSSLHDESLDGSLSSEDDRRRKDFNPAECHRGISVMGGYWRNGIFRFG